MSHCRLLSCIRMCPSNAYAKVMNKPTHELENNIVAEIFAHLDASLKCRQEFVFKYKKYHVASSYRTSDQA